MVTHDGIWPVSAAGAQRATGAATAGHAAKAVRVSAQRKTAGGSDSCAVPIGACWRGRCTSPPLASRLGATPSGQVARRRCPLPPRPARASLPGGGQSGGVAQGHCTVPGETCPRGDQPPLAAAAVAQRRPAPLSSTGRRDGRAPGPGPRGQRRLRGPAPQSEPLRCGGRTGRRPGPVRPGRGPWSAPVLLVRRRAAGALRPHLTPAVRRWRRGGRECGPRGALGARGGLWRAAAAGSGQAVPVAGLAGGSRLWGERARAGVGAGPAGQGGGGTGQPHTPEEPALAHHQRSRGSTPGGAAGVQRNLA
jgi:hypothetical protein